MEFFRSFISGKQFPGFLQHNITLKVVLQVGGNHGEITRGGYKLSVNRLVCPDIRFQLSQIGSTRGNRIQKAIEANAPVTLLYILQGGEALYFIWQYIGQSFDLRCQVFDLLQCGGVEYRFCLDPNQKGGTLVKVFRYEIELSRDGIIFRELTIKIESCLQFRESVTEKRGTEEEENKRVYRLSGSCFQDQ